MTGDGCVEQGTNLLVFNRAINNETIPVKPAKQSQTHKALYEYWVWVLYKSVENKELCVCGY